MAAAVAAAVSVAAAVAAAVDWSPEDAEKREQIYDQMKWAKMFSKRGNPKAILTLGGSIRVYRHINFHHLSYYQLWIYGKAIPYIDWKMLDQNSL